MNYAMQAQTQISPGSAAPQPATQLDVLCGRLADMMVTMLQQGDQLAQLDLRLTGGSPPPASAPGQSNKPREVPSGLLEQMTMAMNDMANQLARTDNLIGHLTSVL